MPLALRQRRPQAKIQKEGRCEEDQPSRAQRKQRVHWKCIKNRYAARQRRATIPTSTPSISRRASRAQSAPCCVQLCIARVKARSARRGAGRSLPKKLQPVRGMSPRYLGVYTRGLPTRITLGHHYVRLQYQNPYQRVDLSFAVVSSRLEMLHGSKAGGPVAVIGPRRGRRAYAAAVAGLRDRLRTPRSLPSRDSHPSQFFSDWSLSAITLLGAIVWPSRRLGPGARRTR